MTSTPSFLRSAASALRFPPASSPTTSSRDRVDTSDAWIQQRTGIKQRYVAGDGETTASLATKAAEAALRHAGLEAVRDRPFVVATSTPDYTFPAVATQVQASLGIVDGAAFDLQAVCTGFVYAVATADKFLRSGSNKRALVIGAETFSRAKLLVLAFEALVSAPEINGTMFRSGHEPGARVVRDARRRPLLERGDESILCKLLGETDVAHDSRETRDNPGGLDPPDRVDRTMCIGSRHGYRSHHFYSVRASRAALRQLHGRHPYGQRAGGSCSLRL